VLVLVVESTPGVFSIQLQWTMGPSHGRATKSHGKCVNNKLLPQTALGGRVETQIFEIDTGSNTDSELLP